MPKTISRQLIQPRPTVDSKYSLLHSVRKDSPAMIYLVRENPELYDFYEVDILCKTFVQRLSGNLQRIEV